MTLPVREQQALDRIEKTLQESDCRLRLMLGVFTALTRHEAMPRTEHVRNDLWMRLSPRAASPIAMLRVLLLSWLAPGQPACGVTSAVPRQASSPVSSCIPARKWRKPRASARWLATRDDQAGDLEAGYPAE